MLNNNKGWLKMVATMVLSLGVCLAPSSLRAQRYLADFDSTLFMVDSLRPLVNRFANLHFSGYIQPQYQVASVKGAPSFNGGNFPAETDNRFMLRRARIKLDYIIPYDGGRFPKALFSFQIDATERGVVVRDMFARLYSPKKHYFSFTTGLFARPFGFEINLSSAFRESPERGRASQILLPTERDLGAMVSYETRLKRGGSLRFDIGAFNGQGVPGPTDFDSFKDLISRLSVRPLELGGGWMLGAGLSGLYGGWRQPTRFRYEMKGNAFEVDSSLVNLNRKLPRRYAGADAQLTYMHSRKRKTEWRAEYWRGMQPGTANTSVSPGVLPLEPYYLRKFDAAFFYFLHQLPNPQWEAILKYDWYDPNTGAADAEVGKGGTRLTATDIRYATLGGGVTYAWSPNLKVLLYYDKVWNEKTSVPGLEGDAKDNTFTARLQLRF